MRKILRASLGAAVATGLVAAALSAHAAPGPETSLLGVRIRSNWKSVLAKYGRPTRIEVGFVTGGGGAGGGATLGAKGSPMSGGMPGAGAPMSGGMAGPSMMSGGMAGAAIMPGMGGMTSGGGRGPMVGGMSGPTGPPSMSGGMGRGRNPMGGMTGPGSMGMIGPGGGMSSGGRGPMGGMTGPGSMGMLGGGSSLPGLGGIGPMSMGMPGGPTMPGMSGGIGPMGMMGGGGGSAAAGSGGGTALADGEVVWVYEKGTSTHQFLFNKEGLVIQIQTFAYKGAATSAGVGIGSSSNRVYAIYGWTDDMTTTGDTLTLNYAKKHNVAFQLVDRHDGRGMRVVGITVALTSAED